MGEPAIPPEADRIATRKLAAAIVASVVDDEKMPLPGLKAVGVPYKGLFFDAVEVENFVFPLAQELDRLHRENEALTKVYVVAARLRQFPVSFDDHFELVGAVDACRSVLEPPIEVSQ